MTSGISFAPGDVWLVRSTLADPIMQRVASRLASTDAALADWVEQGIYAQAVSLELLEPAKRDRVRQAVVAVTRELLADDVLLRSVDESAGLPLDSEREEKRRRTVQRLLELAESEESRRFTSGDSA